MKEMRNKQYSKKAIGLLIYISLEVFVSIGGIILSINDMYHNIAGSKYLLILYSILLIFSIMMFVFKNRIWKNE